MAITRAFSITFTTDFTNTPNPPSTPTVEGWLDSIDSARTTIGEPLTLLSWSNTYNSSTKVMLQHATYDEAVSGALGYADSHVLDDYTSLKADVKSITSSKGVKEYEFYIGDESGEAE